MKADKMAFIVFGFGRQNGAHCVIHTFIIIRTKYSVIARSIATWQSPGRVTALFHKVSVPGDCHATLAMTEYFVPNEIR